MHIGHNQAISISHPASLGYKSPGSVTNNLRLRHDLDIGSPLGFSAPGSEPPQAINDLNELLNGSGQAVISGMICDFLLQNINDLLIVDSDYFMATVAPILLEYIAGHPVEFDINDLGPNTDEDTKNTVDFFNLCIGNTNDINHSWQDEADELDLPLSIRQKAEALERVFFQEVVDADPEFKLEELAKTMTCLILFLKAIPNVTP